MGDNLFDFMKGEGKVSTDVLEEISKRQSGGGSTSSAVAYISVIRPGKNGNENVEAEVGTTISTIMDRLGWESKNHAFKVSTDGNVSNVPDPRTYRVTEGRHTLVVSQKVSGGR